MQVFPGNGTLHETEMPMYLLEGSKVSGGLPKTFSEVRECFPKQREQPDLAESHDRERLLCLLRDATLAEDPAYTCLLRRGYLCRHIK